MTREKVNHVVDGVEPDYYGVMMVELSLIEVDVDDAPTSQPIRLPDWPNWNYSGNHHHWNKDRR